MRTRALALAILGSTISMPPVWAGVVYANDFDGNEAFAAGVSGGIGGTGVVEPVQDFALLAPAFAGSFRRSFEAGNPAPAMTLSLAGLAANAPVQIQFSLAIIDSWDGSDFPPNPSQAPDVFNVVVNGATVFSETFTTLSAAGATQSYTGLALAEETQLGFEIGTFRLDSAYSLIAPGTTDGSGGLVVQFFTSGSGWLAGVSTSGPTEESWAIDTICVTDDDAWSISGAGKPCACLGVQSSLAGTGLLCCGGLATVEVVDACPTAATYLVVGASPLGAPFKGGVLGPQPTIVLSFVTDAAGSLVVPFVWPCGLPSGASLWLQAWIQDPLSGLGFCATPTIQATTP